MDRLVELEVFQVFFSSLHVETQSFIQTPTPPHHHDGNL